MNVKAFKLTRLVSALRSRQRGFFLNPFRFAGGGGGGGGSITIGGTGKNFGGASTVTSSTTTQAAGSTFVVVVAWDNTFTLNSVTDSKGNTYTQIGTTQTNFGFNGSLAFFRCENGTGGASHTATAAFSGNAIGSVIFVELVGVAAASFDVQAQGNAASSPFTLTSPTLGQADAIVISAVSTNSSTNPTTHSESTGFTKIDETTDNANYYTIGLFYKIVSSTAAVTPSFTATTATAAALRLAVFKKA